MKRDLEQFSAECCTILKRDPGVEGRQKVCALVREVLGDEDFIKTYLADDLPERKVLYEDPELGFCILGHVYHGAKDSNPHDHGSSWAIYGQARGETVMTDYTPDQRLHAKAGHGLSLQRRRFAFAKTRRSYPPDPHRGQEHGQGPALPVRARDLTPGRRQVDYPPGGGSGASNSRVSTSPGGSPKLSRMR